MEKVFTLLILILGSCQPDNSNRELPDTQIIKAEENLSSAEQYKDKLDELLTLDIASRNMAQHRENVIIEYSKALKDPVTHSITYGWDNGRVRVIENPAGGGNLEMQALDFVSLSWLKLTNLNEFKRNNQSLISAAKEMKNGNENSHSKTEVLGVGDYALWNQDKGTLKVYYRGMQFEITTETSNGPDLGIAKQVALDIIKTKL